MGKHQTSDGDDEDRKLREQLYAVLCKMLRRQQRNSSAINSVATILKHLEAAGSGAVDTEVNLRRAAQALAEYEGTSL